LTGPYVMQRHPGQHIMLPKGLPNEEDATLKNPPDPRARDDRLWRLLQRLAAAVQNAPPFLGGARDLQLYRRTSLPDIGVREDRALAGAESCAVTSDSSPIADLASSVGSPMSDPLWKTMRWTGWALNLSRFES
jgi:hypothetical protein